MGDLAESSGHTWRDRLGLSAHVKGKTVEELAAVAHQKGMRYFEIVAERLWDLPDGGGKERWHSLKELLAGYGLDPVVHAVYVEMNLSGLNRHLREVAISQTLRCLELAAFLEADHLVVHSGSLNEVYPLSYLPEALDSLRESLRMLVLVGEQVGVNVALENGWNGHDHPVITSAEEHAAVVRSVESPAMKALLDVGHAHTFGLDLTAYLERIRPYLASIHLHDNGGGSDEHLPLGAGTVGLEVMRRCFEAGVPVILEMNSLEDIDTSLDYLEANLGSG